MTATAILQAVLDDLSAALLDEDWPGLQGLLLFPCTLAGAERKIVVATEAQLRAVYDDFLRLLRINRVTDYIRLVDQAIFMEADQISGSCLNHVMSGGHRLLAPFNSTLTLRRDGGRWRVASVINGLVTTRWRRPGPVMPRQDEGER